MRHGKCDKCGQWLPDAFAPRWTTRVEFTVRGRTLLECQTAAVNEIASLEGGTPVRVDWVRSFELTPATTITDGNSDDRRIIVEWEARVVYVPAEHR